MLLLDQFFLKCERGGSQIDPSPEKTTFKKPSLIRVKCQVVQDITIIQMRFEKGFVDRDQ